MFVWKSTCVWFEVVGLQQMFLLAVCCPGLLLGKTNRSIYIHFKLFSVFLVVFIDCIAIASVLV